MAIPRKSCGNSVVFECHREDSDYRNEFHAQKSNYESAFEKKFDGKRSMMKSAKSCSPESVGYLKKCDNRGEIPRWNYGEHSGADINNNKKVFCLRFRRDFLAEKVIITDISYALEEQYSSTSKIIDIEKRKRGWMIWVKGQWMKEQLVQNGLLMKNHLYCMEEVCL